MKMFGGTMLECALVCAAIAGVVRPAPAQETGAHAGVTREATHAARKLAPTAQAQKIVREGVEVEFTIEPVAATDNQPAANLMEEQDVLVRFRVTDTTTRTPLAGVRPSVWLSRRVGEPLTPEGCKEKIKSFLQDSLRAVLVADRSLREVRTGTYESVTRLPSSGAYDVAFLLDSPRITHCFEASVAENPAAKHERAALHPSAHR
ncbi:MAG: hypothetical protein QOC99_1146 [Acidobacteriota bacterium]|nr:hypothetical protein [Acidobacteriota bacterium]